MQTSHKILALTQVQECVPYSSTHIWRMEKAGNFPKRIKLGPNRVGWLASEIDDWIEAKAKGRDDISGEG